MAGKWRLTKVEFILLSAYSAIFPASIAILNAHQSYRWIGVIGLALTLPFGMLLGTILMFLEPFQKHVSIAGLNLMCWLVIFIISYPLYVTIRNDYYSSDYYSSKKNKNLKKKLTTKTREATSLTEENEGEILNDHK
jgi:hypothetical protein